MRILVLSKNSPGATEEAYGADLMGRHVVGHLAARGHEVTVLTAEGAGGGDGGVEVWADLVRDRPDPALQPEQWGARDKLEFLQKARHNYTATREALRKLQPEVVYVSDLELLTGSPLRAVQEAGVPLVFHAHDLTLRQTLCTEAEAPAGGLKQWALDWFLCPPLDRGALRAARLLAVSRSLAEDYQRAGWRADAIRVVYNGIDDRFFRPEPREFPEELSILLAGRCVPEKGLHLAVGAVERLAQRGRRVQLQVVGTFPSAAYEAEIRELAERWQVAEQVTYHGYVAPAEMPALCRRQVCTWAPSLGPESFGLVSVESQAAGTPVVVTQVGGLPETLQAGVTGLVVPPGDAGALAEATERIVADPRVWREMSDAGRAFTAQRFRVGRMVAAVEEALVGAAGTAAR